MGALLTLQRLLFRPVDIAGLVLLRVMFGGLMAWDTARYVAFGWVDSSFLEPPFLFKFAGFMWVGVLPRPLLYAVFGVMVAAGVCIAIGLYYRLSCLLFFLGHTYIFLLASSYYLNHAYLISLFTLLLMFVPAHRALSFDAQRDPTLHSRKIPAWPLWLLCGTLTVVFVYGGIAKLNADWFAGEPVRHWLAHRAESSVAAALLRHETTIYAVCYGGALFDLLVGPALLWKRTRIAAALASAAFHLSNAYLFNIGVFPWFMLAATTLFFDQGWPLRVWPGLERYLDAKGGEADVGAEAAASEADEARRAAVDVPVSVQRRMTLAICAVMLVQMLIPLRHHLYPGNVAWTEEGHYFSWRMKLRHKDGRATFRISAPQSGAKWTVNPAEQLTERQQRKMPGHPDMLLQYAHYLRDAYRRDTGEDVEVRADVFVSLNYRPEQRFVDPQVDLGKQPFSLGHDSWLLPFEDTPLPSPAIKLQSRLGSLAAELRLKSRLSGSVRPPMGPSQRLPRAINPPQRQP